MNSWRVAWRRIGGPDAVTWPAFWISFAANAIGQFATPGQVPAPGWVRIIAVVASQVALFVPLVLLRVALLDRASRPHPWAVLAGFAFGIIVRSAVLAWVLAVLGGVTTPPLTTRIAGAFLNLFLALVITAIVVGAVREHRRDLATLAQVRRELEHTLTQVQVEVAERNEEALQRVTSTLEHELQIIDATSDEDTALALHRLAVDVVRPLSHELERSLDQVSPQAAQEPSTRIGLPEVVRSLGTRGPALPLATAVVISLTMLWGTVIYMSAAWVPVMLASLVGTFIALRMANGILDRALPRSTTSRSVGLAIATLLIASSLPACCAGWGVGGAPGVVLAIAGTIFVFGFTMLLALANCLLTEQRHVEIELAESDRLLKSHVVRMRQVQWFQQRSLSRALHGPVQSAATAAALRLDAALHAGVATPEVVREVRTTLRAQIDILSDDLPMPLTVDEFVTRLTGIWDGVCAVRTTLDADARDALTDDPILRSTVMEIVTEAVSNAVRHGNARVVEVAISAETGATLQLEVTDNGTRSEGTLDVGMGSRMMQQCSLDWDLSAFDDGRRLVVTFPVVAEAVL